MTHMRGSIPNYFPYGVSSAVLASEKSPKIVADLLRTRVLILALSSIITRFFLNKS